MKELEVRPCANGKLCDAVYDPRDNTIVIFQYGQALGYICLSDIQASCSDE